MVLMYFFVSVSSKMSEIRTQFATYIIHICHVKKIMHRALVFRSLSVFPWRFFYSFALTLGAICWILNKNKRIFNGKQKPVCHRMVCCLAHCSKTEQKRENRMTSLHIENPQTELNGNGILLFDFWHKQIKNSCKIIETWINKTIVMVQYTKSIRVKMKRRQTRLDRMKWMNDWIWKEKKKTQKNETKFGQTNKECVRAPKHKKNWWRWKEIHQRKKRDIIIMVWEQRDFTQQTHCQTWTYLRWFKLGEYICVKRTRSESKITDTLFCDETCASDRTQTQTKGDIHTQNWPTHDVIQKIYRKRIRTHACACLPICVYLRLCLVYIRFSIHISFFFFFGF